MNIRNLVNQYIDVDAILKNDEVVQWYERLRKAGFVFLLFNFAYLFGYMCFRVIADFTISSFLFGYFIQSICNISSFVSDTFLNNEREIRGYVGKQLGNWIGAIKVAVDYAEEYFEGKSTTVDNSKSSVSDVAPPSQESSQKSASTPSRPPITISLFANSVTVKNNIAESQPDKESDTTESVTSTVDKSAQDASSAQSTNIDLNIETKTKDTVIRLDPTVLEYLLRRNEAQNALMNKVMKLDQSIIDPATSTSVDTSVSSDNANYNNVSSDNPARVVSESETPNLDDAQHIHSDEDCSDSESYHDSQSGSDGDNENLLEISRSELMSSDISHSEDEDGNRESYRSHKDQ
jgi:hypothetical protein